MELLSKESGALALFKEKEPFTMQTKMSTMVSGLTLELMDSELTQIQMEPPTKGSGNMTCSTEKGKKPG